MFFLYINWSTNECVLFEILNLVAQKHQFPRCSAEAATMIAEGYLRAVVDDIAKPPKYWNDLLKDFPDHPAPSRDANLNRSIGCTLY